MHKITLSVLLPLTVCAAEPRNHFLYSFSFLLMLFSYRAIQIKKKKSFTSNITLAVDACSLICGLLGFLFPFATASSFHLYEIYHFSSLLFFPINNTWAEAYMNGWLNSKCVVKQMYVTEKKVLRHIILKSVPECVSFSTLFHFSLRSPKILFSHVLKNLRVNFICHNNFHVAHFLILKY